MGNLCALFSLFSLEHFIYILLAILICFACVWFLRKFEDKSKVLKIIFMSLTGFFIVLEYIGRVMGDLKFNIFESLPLNAFQIFAIVCLFILIKNKKSWVKFAYLIILPISALSIIFIPTYYTTLGSFSLAVVGFVFANICLIIFSLLNIIWCEDEMSHKDILDTFINFLIFLSAAHIINVILRFAGWGLEADYFGTMAEGYNTYIGLISKLIPVPFVCHLPLIAILYGIEYLLKIPFYVLKTKREHREQMEELIALGNLRAQQKYRESKRKSGSHILINSKGASNKDSGYVSRKEDFVRLNKEVETNNSVDEDK